MPKQQSKIQESVKCKISFASYWIQPKCNECQSIDEFVKTHLEEENEFKEFVSKETSRKE